MLKKKGDHDKFWLARLLELHKLFLSYIVHLCFHKLLHLYPIFPVKYKEMKAGSRLLHSTVYQYSRGKRPMKLVNIYLFCHIRFARVKCLNGEMLNTFVLKIELYYILYNLVWYQLSRLSASCWSGFSHQFIPILNTHGDSVLCRKAYLFATEICWASDLKHFYCHLDRIYNYIQSKWHFLSRPDI